MPGAVEAFVIRYCPQMWHCPRHRRTLPSSSCSGWHCGPFLGMINGKAHRETGKLCVSGQACRGTGSRDEIARTLYLGVPDGCSKFISFSATDACVFAASESKVLGSNWVAAKTPLCERSPREPSLPQSWSLSAWGSSPSD